MNANHLWTVTAHVACVSISVLVIIFLIKWDLIERDHRDSKIPALSDAYTNGTITDAEKDVWRTIIDLELKTIAERSIDSIHMAAPILACRYSQLGRIEEVQNNTETANILYEKAIYFAEKGGIANDLKPLFKNNREICHFLADSTDKILNPRWRRELGLTDYLGLPDK